MTIREKSGEVIATLENTNTIKKLASMFNYRSNYFNKLNYNLVEVVNKDSTKYYLSLCDYLTLISYKLRLSSND